MLKHGLRDLLMHTELNESIIQFELKLAAFSYYSDFDYLYRPKVLFEKIYSL